jgi:hypothetical protein
VEAAATPDKQSWSRSSMGGGKRSEEEEWMDLSLLLRRGKGKKIGDAPGF